MRRSYRSLITLLPFLVLIGFASAGAVQAGGGCHGGSGAVATEATSSVVKIDGCTFAPTVTRVPLGTEVTFLNTSQSPHDVTGRSGEWGSQLLESGAKFSERFTAAGLYAYSCSLHPGMAGVVVVGSPDLTLASEVTPATTQPAATAEGLAPLPIMAAGGVGLLLGALGMAVIRRRGETTD